MKNQPGSLENNHKKVRGRVNPTQHKNQHFKESVRRQSSLLSNLPERDNEKHTKSEGK